MVPYYTGKDVCVFVFLENWMMEYKALYFKVVYEGANSEVVTHFN